VTDAALRAAFESEWGRVVATLIRWTGDWALAEDCAQDAFAAAAERWPVEGVPDRPGAWLTTTARNRALDRLRRATTESRKLQEIARSAEMPADEDVPDDRLRLIFTCCHPALPLEARVPLTLRTLCGLTIAEIARAFGASEDAMAKRLVRARGKIAHAGIPYRLPDAGALPERRDGVLAVLYLLFTEGYAPSAGDAVVREPLSAEAIRLTTLLADLLPADSEVLGLLALELLQDSRRAARTGADGAPVPLEDQDRTLWDRTRAEAGAAALRRAGAVPGPPGPYELQARIALQHTAPDGPDWVAVADLYERLDRLTPSPYVRLARAVAVGMADGPDAGLALLRGLRSDRRLAGDPYLSAAEADLHRRAGRAGPAAEAYRAALALVRNDAERRFLSRRLADLT
jgi:RNA polymerase sigma-70 factor, ECF subfamily